MITKPNLSFWKLWNLSFGFFGVQIAYALQSANISRIFATLGADPHNLSYFWILPPLMGILVQPIVGTLSDKTWCRFGRRIPYLFVGATIAVLVMCLLPNSGSLGLTVSGAMLFGLIALMFPSGSRWKSRSDLCWTSCNLKRRSGRKSPYVSGNYRWLGYWNYQEL